MKDKISNVLRFDKVTSDQIGTYQCIARNSLGSDTVQFDVTVKDPAFVVSVKLEEEKSVRERSATISCVVKGSPLPQISWFNWDLLVLSTDKVDLETFDSKTSNILLDSKGQQVSEYDLRRLREKFYAKLSMQEHNLRLDMIFENGNSADFNNFKCEAKNMHGVSEKEIQIDEATQKKLLRFTDGRGDDVNHDVQFGEQLDLNCEIESLSKSNVRWIFVSFREVFCLLIIFYYQSTEW